MAFWNEFDIKIPTLTTTSVKEPQFVNKVKRVFEDGLVFYENQTEFEQTAALLSRLMAKRKNSFAKMHGFKSLCKLNAALCRLLRLDIKEIFRNIIGSLPDNATKSDVVPTRNTFNYTLIRLIGQHKLLQRISLCCLQSASYFAKLLEKNFFVETVTLLLAVIAKLWKFTNDIGNRTVQLYSDLFIFLDKFPKSQTKMFDKVKFPKKLDKFGSNGTSNNNACQTTSQQPKIMMEAIESSEPVLKEITDVVVSSLIFDEEDVGTVISRDTVKSGFDINNICSAEDITKFFKKEDKKRKLGESDSLTKLIPHQEWIRIKKTVNNKIIANNHKKAISAFKEHLCNKM